MSARISLPVSIDVDVVAVELLGLVALGRVVGGEPFGRLLEQAPRGRARTGRAGGSITSSKRGAPEDHRSSRYSAACRSAAASHVSSARARSAPARARGERLRVGEQLARRLGQRLDVPGRHDAAGAVTRDRLAEAADVVDDRRDARPERLQQRARLVELGAIREDRDRRVRERALELGRRRDSRAAIRRAAPRGARRAASPGRRRRAGGRRRGGGRPRRRRRGPCTAG